jgi:hypothetical protein
MSGAGIGAVIRRAYGQGCEVTMRAGRKCGEPVVATVAGKRVCQRHEDSAAEAAAYVQTILRGDL